MWRRGLFNFYNIQIRPLLALQTSAQFQVFKCVLFKCLSVLVSCLNCFFKWESMSCQFQHEGGGGGNLLRLLCIPDCINVRVEDL